MQVLPIEVEKALSQFLIHLFHSAQLPFHKLWATPGEKESVSAVYDMELVREQIL